MHNIYILPYKHQITHDLGDGTARSITITITKFIYRRNGKHTNTSQGLLIPTNNINNKDTNKRYKVKSIKMRLRSQIKLQFKLID